MLTKSCDKQKVSIATLIMGKQAGLDINVAYSETENIPESDLYFIPTSTPWHTLYSHTWDAVMERVRNGATLCMRHFDGDLYDFEEAVGARSNGTVSAKAHTAKIGNKEFTYSGKEFLLEPLAAEVISRNEEGNPVLLKNKVGKGYVYLINFEPEILAFDTADGFNKEPYYELYREVAKDIISAKPVYTENPDLGITLNPENDSMILATVLNYSDKDIMGDFEIRNGYKIKEVLYGEIENIPACDGVILRLEK